MPMAADNLDLSQLNSDTRYSIMFGPDKCGSNNKIHFIIQYQNPISKEWEEKHFNTTIAMRSDKSKTHLYTLHIKSNNDFEIYVDRKEASRGNLLTHMTPPINPEKYIDDKDDRQPAGNHVHPSVLSTALLAWSQNTTVYHHSDTLVITSGSKDNKCTTLYCTDLHCTDLHCTDLHCTALHCTALHCTALQQIDE